MRRLMNSLFIIVVSVGTAIGSLECAPGAEPAKTRTVEVGEIKLTVPESWTQKAVTSPMRLAQFLVPASDGDKEPADVGVFHFGAGSGGGIDANVQRWIKQFQPKGRTAKVTSGKSSSGEYVLVDVSGTWMKPVGRMVEQRTKETPNSRAIGVILTVKDQGNYFIRLTGPEKTVSANADAFRASFAADVKSEKDYKVSDEN